MNHTAHQLALICLLSVYQFACSASDPGTVALGAGGSVNHGGSAGSSSQAGGSAAGANSASGGVGGSAGSSGGAGSSGQAAGGTSAGGATGGAAGTGVTGASGAAGSGGGSALRCTPGTGTEPVGSASLLDQKTCLTWTKARSTTTLTNKQADKYCSDLSQDGITDWRVPTPEELVTWPGLTTADTAYITGPIYIPTGGTVMDGCTGNSHSCNIAEYSDNNLSCAWQGVGFLGWVACVSGTASAGTTKAAYAAMNCSPCNSELATFQVQDCSAYAN